MRQAFVHRFAARDPGDASGLSAAMAEGVIDPRAIVAVIGKTHGNGLVNDYSRAHLTLALSLAIAEATGEPRQSITTRIPFVFSGGVEGVLSPHYTVFAVADAPEAAAGPPALAIGTALSARLAPHAIGREAQIAATADAVARACAEAGLTPDDVRFVQVKGPAPTAADLNLAAAAGHAPVTREPGKLMAYGRAASALGVIRALGEAPHERTLEAAALTDFDVWSARASISAGTEVHCNEVIVLGMSHRWTGPLAIGCRPMADALDLAAAIGALADVGLTAAPTLSAADAGRLKAAFVKAEPDRSGLVRGRPHTMLEDGDVDAQRHVRAAAGAVVAAVLNDTAIFVSGGAEHQGPTGGGLMAVIVERSKTA